MCRDLIFYLTCMDGPRVRHWQGAISSGLGQREPVLPSWVAVRLVTSSSCSQPCLPISALSGLSHLLYSLLHPCKTYIQSVLIQ